MQNQFRSVSSIQLRAFFVCLALFACGCAAHDRITGVSNTFLEDVDIRAKKENLPFDHSWSKEGVHKGNYSKVFIKPVRLDKLPDDSWKTSASAAIPGKADYLESVKELGGYFRSQLAMKISQTPNSKISLSNGPGPGTLIVEIAFTEVEFSHPIARAGALVAPVPGTGPALSAFSDPHVAFAMRIRDGKTGELLATLADRKFPPTRIVDLNKLTATSSAREVCALWADLLARSLASSPGEKVDESHFSLLPW